MCDQEGHVSASNVDTLADAPGLLPVDREMERGLERELNQNMMATGAAARQITREPTKAEKEAQALKDAYQRYQDLGAEIGVQVTAFCDKNTFMKDQKRRDILRQQLTMEAIKHRIPFEKMQTALALPEDNRTMLEID